MFKKPFKIASTNLLKSSDKRKLRTDVLRAFPSCDDASLNAVFGSKDDVTCAKVAQSHMLIYFVGPTPIFFDTNGKGDIFPTVYTLMRVPHMMLVLYTHSLVSVRMLGGADLMLPGVLVPQEGLGPILVYQKRAVIVAGNPIPFAVGTMNVHDEDIRKKGMVGKGLKVVHVFGDTLWQQGGPHDMPLGFTLDRIFRLAAPSSGDQQHQQGEEEEEEDVESALMENLEISEAATSAAPPIQQQQEGTGGGGPSSITPTTTLETPPEIQKSENFEKNFEKISKSEESSESENSTSESEEESSEATRAKKPKKLSKKYAERLSKKQQQKGVENLSVEIPTAGGGGGGATLPTYILDRLLERRFLMCCQTLTKSDLPILISQFFSLKMIGPACASGGGASAASAGAGSIPGSGGNLSFLLDVKKSSYKKVGKMVQSFVEKGYVEMGEASSGVDQITKINARQVKEGLAQTADSELDAILANALAESNSQLQQHESGQQQQASGGPSRGGSGKSAYTICDYYKPIPSLSELFVDISKDHLVTKNQAVEYLENYCRAKGLMVPGQGSVRMDTLLWDVVCKRKGTVGEIVQMPVLINSLLERLQHYYSISHCDSTEEPTIRKGQLAPISVVAERRMGTKHVTLVRGLEGFGLDPSEIAKRLQKQFAASTTTSPLPGKGKTDEEIMLQGHFLLEVAEFLVKEFGIPKKFIETLNKEKPKK